MLSANRRATQLRELQVRGASSYSSEGTAKIPINEIEPVGAVPDGVTYLQAILLTIDYVITENNTSAQTLEEKRALDVIQRIFLRVPGEEEGAIYDLSTNAGSKLYNFLHCVNGRRPRGPNGGGNVSVAKGTTTNVRIKLLIPFNFPTMAKPDEFEWPVDLLQGASLELKWAAGATVFGAAQPVTSGSIQAHAILIERDEFRVPVRFCVKNEVLSGVNEKVPCAGKVLLGLLEVQDNGDAVLTEEELPDAERNDLSLIIDGHHFTQKVDFIDQVELWNATAPVTRDDELAQVEGNLTPFVPLVWPALFGGRSSYAPLPKKDPKYVVTGTELTPELIVWTSALNTRRAVMDQLTAADVEIPAGMTQENAHGYLTAKSASKDTVKRGAAGAARMAIRLHDEELKAAAK